MARAATGRQRRATSITAPLRVAAFRALWLATMVSNFGWLVQSVGAAWLMTSLSGRADMVALVQAAVQAPILVISLLAGAAADVLDRRRVLLTAQLWMLVASVLLAALTAAGYIGPWSLLGLTFALGLGAALQGPAYQAVVRELIPGEEFAAAVTLNAVSFNFARAAGPALGGAIVATAGAGAAFALNALSYAPLILVLLLWRRPSPREELPRERVGPAIVTGLRYVAETPAIRTAVLRSALFAFGAAAALALLPLVARDLLGGGPIIYGVLLGAFGAGAMAGAFLVHPMRHRFGAEPVATALTAVFGLALLTLGLVPPLPVVIAALAGAGAAWLGSFSTFNIAVQTVSAFWVQARVFALYQTVMFGAMALGSWLWGEVAHAFGLTTTLLLVGAVMLSSLAASLRWRLPTGPAPDLRPLPRSPEPAVVLDLDPEEGPVLVQVEYRVKPEHARAFARAMDEVGHLRKRNGASRWGLFQDVTDAEHWVEAFTVASWLDYRRQTRRATTADAAIEAGATKYHDGPDPPLLRHMVARRPA